MSIKDATMHTLYVCVQNEKEKKNKKDHLAQNDEQMLVLVD